jgi:hypothetical protein
MSVIANALRGIVGLFFDDGTLALVIVALLIVTGYARHADWISDSVAMSILIAGTIAALLENVLRFARHSGRS